MERAPSENEAGDSQEASSGEEYVFDPDHMMDHPLEEYDDGVDWAKYYPDEPPAKQEPVNSVDSPHDDPDTPPPSTGHHS